MSESSIDNWTGGAAAPEATEAPPAASWYLDESVEGVGDRPEWLEPKYKTVAEQAKAYKEVERRLGQSQGQAPEEYDFEPYKEVFDVDNPFMVNLKTSAKDLKLSQDAFDKILDPIAKYQQSLIPNPDDEIKKLGDHGPAKIKTVNTWASNHLSEKAMDTLSRISNTAEVVELMDEMRQLHYQTVSRVPTNMQTITKPTLLSPETIQNEIVNNYQKYQQDPAYRQEMSNKLKQAFGED
jgi:hypothetical protein